MNLPVLALTAVAFAALGVWVLRARPHDPSHVRFCGYTGLVSAWTMAIAGVHSGSHPAAWGALTFAAAALIPPAFLDFARHYPTVARWPGSRLVRAAWAIGVTFAGLALCTPFVAHSFVLVHGRLQRVAGPLYPAFAGYFLAVWTLGALVLLQKCRAAHGHLRSQLGWIAGGLLAHGVLAITTNLVLPLATGRSTYTWLGPAFGVITLALTAHAIIRYRAMDLRLRIHRTAAIAFATAVSLLPLVLAIRLLWRKLERHVSSDELALLAVLLLAVAGAAPVGRDLLCRLLDHYFFRSRRDHHRTLRETSAALARHLETDVIVSRVGHAVLESTAAEGVAVYVQGRDTPARLAGEVRQPGARFGAPPEPPEPITAALGHRDALGLDPAVAHEAPSSELLAHLRALDWAVVLPLRAEGALVGLVAIGPKRSGDPFEARELDLLGTLANQAGIAIKNGELYGEVVLAREYIETVLATIESGVVAVDGAGRPVMVNRAAARLAGLRTGDAAGGPGDALPASLAALLRDTLADGRGRTVPELVLAPERADDPVLCVTSPLRAPSGAPVGAVAVLSDLGPLRALERERRRAERLAYFEALAAALAHEIKNPLVGIKTFAQLMPRRHHDPQFLAEFSRVVAGQVQRMERLLTRLQRLSRPSRRPRERVDLGAVVRGAAALVHPAFEDKRVRLVVETDADPTPVAGDPAELEELFVNLLTNAREATPPGGTVSIAMAAADGRVTVTVADTGPGIAPAHLEHVFDPFFTTRPGGSGLGLAVAASIAESHGARLHVANRPAGGALVTFDVPTAPPVEALACR